MTARSAHPYRVRPGTRYCAGCGQPGRHNKQRKPDGRVEYRCDTCINDPKGKGAIPWPE